MRISTICLATALTFALSAPAWGWAPPPPDPTEDPVMMAAGFLSGHPDLRFRLLGLEEMKKEQYDDAFMFFQRASFYADKPSQAMVAEMLWDGRGTTRDRALAYAWMDLASERGYRGFLGLREKYWSELTPSERERAVAEGQAIYARFGDAAAKPRIANTLRRERSLMTGSRTGFTGNLQIYVPGPGNQYERIDGSKFFDPRYWDPDQYQAWHDAIWMKPRIGRVDVGELEKVESAPGSRVPATTPQVDAPEPSTPPVDESKLGTQPRP